MDDKELEEQQKQADLDKASQKTAHVAGKALATYYGGAQGAKIYDALSKTELGQGIENAAGKTLQKNPIDRALVKKANDSGILDAADNALDSKNDENSSGLDKKSGLDLKKNNKNISDSDDNIDSKSFLDRFKGNKTSFLDGLISKENRIKYLIFIIAFAFYMIVAAVGVVIMTIYGPVETVINFATNAWGTVVSTWNDVVDFFSGDSMELEHTYYTTLKNVQDEMKFKYNVCIDINLITATLTVDRAFDSMLDEDNEIIESTDEEGNFLSFTKMEQQVELLANMQMVRKKYGLDSSIYDSNSSYCIENDSSLEQYELVNSDTAKNFKNDKVKDISKIDSSSYELISQHDLKDEWWEFFGKKTFEEKNYAYYFYRPYFDEEGKCDDDLPDDEYEISIGDSNTMVDSVYYWNLINSFIPEYYADFIPKDEPLRTEKIKQIAEEIYLLYDEFGPSQTCYVNNSYICRNDEGAGFYGGGDKKLTIEEFTQNVSPIAIEEMTRTGIFSSITLSQAALESGNGASGLSKNYSNYYGMTAGSCAPSQSPDTATGSVLQSGENGNECTGNQFWNGSIVALCNSQGEDCQWYRIYDSFLNSTRDHSRLLAQGYGCNVYNTYSEQLDCLVSHGYATDPKYKDKIMNVITTNNLNSYDIGTFNGTYQDISGNSFVNNFCSGDGVITYAGEFTSWKQNDARWKTVKLGTSTVGKIGCAMTSVTIQILRSGVNNILGSNLNPGTFATTLTELGGFDASGGIYWASAAKIAPNFKFVDVIRRYAAPSEIAEKVNQGYFVILNVKNGRHWVAVDRVEGDKIYMFDPGSGGNEVGHTYGLNSIVGYVYYRRG